MANGKKYKKRADEISKYAQKKFKKDYPKKFQEYIENKNKKAQQKKQFLEDVRKNECIQAYLEEIEKERIFQRDCDNQFKEYINKRLTKKNGPLDTIQILETELATTTQVQGSDGLVVQTVHKVDKKLKHATASYKYSWNMPDSKCTYEGFDYYLGEGLPNELTYSKVTASVFKGLEYVANGIILKEDDVIVYSGFSRNADGEYSPIEVVTNQYDYKEKHYGKLSELFSYRIKRIEAPVEEYEENEMDK